MNFYETEMRKLFGNNQVIYDRKFCGKMCIGKIDEDLRVKLNFTTSNISNQYNTISVSIINRTEGVVDKQLFKFKDIIGIKHTNNPNFHNGVYPHIWNDQGNPKWYIYHPTTEDYKAISNTITEYVAMYQQNVSMEFTEPSM
jgi:hypothetical protein